VDSWDVDHPEVFSFVTRRSAESASAPVASRPASSSGRPLV
jgi:hypothetical protein